MLSRKLRNIFFSDMYLMNVQQRFYRIQSAYLAFFAHHLLGAHFPRNWKMNHFERRCRGALPKYAPLVEIDYRWY